MKTQRKHIEEAVANGKGCSCACSRAPESRIAQKPLKAALILLLVFAMLLTATGCRYSNVLTEKIIEAPNVAEIDYSLDPMRVENPNQESANQNTDYESSDAERQGDPEESLPDYTQDSPTVETETAQQEHSDQPYEEGEASEGGESDDNDGSASNADPARGTDGGAKDEGGNDGPVAGADEGDQEKVDEPTTVTVDPNPVPGDDPQTVDNEPVDNGGNESTDNTWNPGTGNVGGGDGGKDADKGQTYNDGTFAQLPQNNSKIAAAGPYATIVQSLGGRGALAATNQKWLDDLPYGAYGKGSDDSELVDVVGIPSWGDGASMDDATIQAIIDSGAEVVITSDSYGGVSTDAQARALNEAGVNVVVLPPIGMPDALDGDVQTCVEVTGELLKDAGSDIQYDAKAMAAEWTRLHDQAIQNTLTANGGYTPFVSALETQNKILQGLHGSEREFDGPSSRQYYASYIDYWLDADSLVGLDGDGAVSDSDQNWRHSQWVYPYTEWGVGTIGVDWSDSYCRFDVSNGLGLYIAMSTPREAARSSYAIIDYYLQCGGVCDEYAGAQYSSGTVGFTYYPYGTTCVVAGNAWIKFGQGASETRILPGDEASPYILVRDKSIAQNVYASATRPADKDAAIIGAYDFGQAYGVAVIPSGIGGSWADGTFESFLLAPWAYCMYQPVADLRDCDGYVESFYAEFYRCGAGGILDGGGNWGDASADGASCGGYGYVVNVER